MKTSFIFCLLLFFALKAAALARLGDTEEQCRARYGNPEIFMPDAEAIKRLELGAYGNSEDYVGDINEHVEKPSIFPDKMLEYESNSASIIVGFKNDKAISIQYRFGDEGTSVLLSGAMIESLLQLNSPQTAWFCDNPSALDDSVPIGDDGKPLQEAELDKWVGEVRLPNSRGSLWSTDGKFYAKFDRSEGVVSILSGSIRPTYKFDRDKRQLTEGF